MKKRLGLSFAGIILAVTAGAGIAQHMDEGFGRLPEGSELSEAMKRGVARNARMEMFHVSHAEPGNLNLSVTETYSLDNDHAEIIFGMITEGDDPAEVMTRNNEKMSEIIEGLGDVGIDDQDVTTSGINLQPVFTGGPTATRSGVVEGEMRITGYRMQNDITVKVSDLAIIGDVVSGAIEAGANSVNGFSMGATPDPDKALEIRNAAIERAGQEARSIAAAAGARIVGISTIEVYEGGSAGPQPMMRMTASDTGVVPVSSGQSENRVTVVASYKIVMEGRRKDREGFDDWKRKDERRRQDDVMIAPEKTSAEE